MNLNKPIYTGMCTSDLSQGITCKFHYDYIKNNNGAKS